MRDRRPQRRLKDLKKIGYWHSDREPDLPKAQDFVDREWDATERAAVLAYLKRGGTNNRWRGSSRCRICNSRNGSRCLTDGTYVWPSGLSHYVEEHGLRPEQAFVDHVLGDERKDRRPYG